jgi:uracil-DNA glycosylase family 4
MKKKIVIIGEAPGAEEEKAGIPFVGKCGKLLDRALEIAVNGEDLGYDFYFLNSVFWRPKFQKNLDLSKKFSNRSPTEEEISWCRPYVFEHLRLLRPSKIICLGKVSFALLQDLSQSEIRKIKFSNLVGKVFDLSFQNLIAPCKIHPNFHPAFVLRNEKNLFKKFSLDLKEFVCS